MPVSETLPAHVLMVGHFFCANVGIVRPDALAPSEVISLYAPSLHPLAGADPGEANRPVSRHPRPEPERPQGRRRAGFMRRDDCGAVL